MTKIYLLKYALTTGIHTFEVPEEDFQTDRVWIRVQGHFYKLDDVALSEEEALIKVHDTLQGAFDKESQRHERTINKLNKIQLNINRGVLPKITDH